MKEKLKAYIEARLPILVVDIQDIAMPVRDFEFTSEAATKPTTKAEMKARKTSDVSRSTR